VLDEKGAGLRLSELNNLQERGPWLSPVQVTWGEQKLKLVRSAVDGPPLAANRPDANTPDCMGQLLVRTEICGVAPSLFCDLDRCVPSNTEEQIY
jgi:hypothetical protein